MEVTLLPLTFMEVVLLSLTSMEIHSTPMEVGGHFRYW